MMVPGVAAAAAAAAAAAGGVPRLCEQLVNNTDYCSYSRVVAVTQ